MLHAGSDGFEASGGLSVVRPSGPGAWAVFPLSRGSWWKYQDYPFSLRRCSESSTPTQKVEREVEKALT